MSEVEQSSGQTQEVSDSQGQETVRDPEAVLRKNSELLSEKKSLKEELEALKIQVQSYEEKDLETKGKHEELIQSLREQLKQTKEQYSKEKASYAWKTVSGHIAREAEKQGCVDADALLRLLDKEDLDALEVKDDYTLNRDDLGHLMEKASKRYGYLFRKKNPNIADAIPGKVEQPAPKTVANLTLDEKVKLLAKTMGQKP